MQLVSTGPLTDANTLNVAGGHGEGTIGLNFYPDAATSEEHGIVAFRELMEKYHPGKAVNNYSLYGYVYGKLILAGLEAAGPNVTKERFINAMEELEDWPSGGIMPRFLYRRPITTLNRGPSWLNSKRGCSFRSQVGSTQ